jgi:hypothetical protein
MSTVTSFRLALLTSVVALAGTPLLLAQPRGGGGAPAAEVEFAIGHSGGADSEFANRSGAEVAVTAFELSAKTRRALRQDLFLGYGLKLEHFDIDAPASVPLPDRLQGLAVELSATRVFSPEWTGTVVLSPGLYAASGDFGGDAFNVPVLALATWRSGPDLSLFGGARYDGFSDTPVIPFLGVRWQATPEVTLTVGAPRTEVSYRGAGDREWFFGASFQGGGFAVDDAALPVPAGYPRLRDTVVDYREIRIGGGLRMPLGEGLRLELEAGWMVDRRFDYHERSLEVKTDGAASVRLGLSARF